MEKQAFIDRILETENLTDMLEDEDANWLINWGISKIDRVLLMISDEEAAGEKITSLMALMRKLNRLSASYNEDSAEDLLDTFNIINELFIATFSTNLNVVVQPGTDRYQSFMAQLPQMKTRDLLEYLVQWPDWPHLIP